MDDVNQINLAMWETCPENEWNFVGEFNAIKQKHLSFYEGRKTIGLYELT